MNSKKIIILALEPIETRYTSQWFEKIPQLLQNHVDSSNIDRNFEIIQIDGSGPNYEVSPATTGAFLDFYNTNIWKNNQINKLVKLFQDKQIKAGDKILVTDAWNTGILQIRYMSQLMDVPIQIHSLWHAGSYDENDFLGRKIFDKDWTYNTERAIFHASDYNYFATEYHKELFIDNLGLREHDGLYDEEKIVVAGFPFEYLINELQPYKKAGDQDRKSIVFPHRISDEKQLDIFKDLAKQLPQYDWIVCQENTLTKHEYHTILSNATAVFSANLQETLGISMYEALLTNTVPIVPDRLSYTEMYFQCFKYPSEWTESYTSYLKYKDRLVDLIKSIMEYTIIKQFQPIIDDQIKALDKFFNSKDLFHHLIIS